MLKPVFAFLFFCLSICSSQAQRSLSGLWSGTITNDSVTIRKEDTFEIALTQYKEKVYGYTRSSFIVNDELYYIIKRVKGTIKGDICEILDDEIVSYNFPGKPDKGVKVKTVFRLNHADSTWYMDGKWNTEVKRRFYEITGTIHLQEETNLNHSKLLPHLEELKLAKELDFYVAKNPSPALATNTKADKPATKNNNEPIVKQESKPASTQAVGKATSQQPIASNPIVVAQVPPAALVKERKAAPPQIVNFKSDSIQLSIYDNGEIDGDTVSVLLNGEVILAKQGLKATAIRRTIYIQSGTNEVTLVLYAENLGKYPPNTGLLVVKDGEQTYQVRFSADLQQNATVIFRRKQ